MNRAYLDSNISMVMIIALMPSVVISGVGYLHMEAR